MKRKYSSIIVLLLGVFTLVSCLKSDNDDVIYYEDTAITSFSIGTLNRYVHTITSSGKDSVYKVTLDGSKYAFNIDQTNRVIYNPDSLPVGVDASKVLTTVSTKNSGVVLVNLKTKDGSKDSLIYQNSTDSLDFTKPVEMRVYNISGSSFRTYMVHVNVHQEKADEFHWNQVAQNDALVASMKGMRTLAYDGKVWLMGNDGNGSHIFVSDAKSSLSWALVSQEVYSADAYKSFTLSMGVPTFLSNGNMYQFFKNGEAYECRTASTPNIASLVGGTEHSIFGYSADGKLMVSTSFGNAWSESLLDTNNEWLPKQDVNLITIPLKTNLQVEKLLLIGNRDASAFPSDTSAVVWSKIDETSESAMNQPWLFYSNVADNKYRLPRMRNLQVIGYNGMMLAIGGDAINGTTKAFSQFYKSADEGMTWQNDTIYKMPKGFVSSTSIFSMMCDEDNFIWIFGGESGQVWKGRLNELGWRKEQGAFEE